MVIGVDTIHSVERISQTRHGVDLSDCTVSIDKSCYHTDEDDKCANRPSAG